VRIRYALFAYLVFGAAFLTGVLYGVWYEQIRTGQLERELDQKREIVRWLDRVLLIRQAEQKRDKEKEEHYLKLFDEVSKLLQNEK